MSVPARTVAAGNPIGKREVAMHPREGRFVRERSRSAAARRETARDTR
jgi:hypothetical protein